MFDLICALSRWRYGWRSIVLIEHIACRDVSVCYLVCGYEENVSGNRGIRETLQGKASRRIVFGGGPTGTVWAGGHYGAFDSREPVKPDAFRCGFSCRRLLERRHSPVSHNEPLPVG